MKPLFPSPRAARSRAQRRRRRPGRPCATLAPDPTWSSAARSVARRFELGASAIGGRPIPTMPIPEPAPGQIVLVTGPSGAGKSSLLRHLRDTTPRPVVDCATIPWTDGLVIDQFGQDVEAGLALLSRFGLGEAQTYLRPPAHLSDGQRWRLRLARAVHRVTRDDSSTRCAPILLADEFCAVLDRLTAMIVARALRRAVDATPGLCAVVATSHEDLEEALVADVVVRCDFGEVRVEVNPKLEARAVKPAQPDNPKRIRNAEEESTKRTRAAPF
jgi:ABC-type lipoprotein export system ATPase subunit